MDTNLHHEDLLIKLRAKLNEEKIKLWESPYVLAEDVVSQSLQDLAKKYATELSVDYEIILHALRELQLHSLDRSKANSEFKETGLATFRVKATVPGEVSRILRVQKKLDEMGSELIRAVASLLDVSDTRVKLIFNGKVIKPTPSIGEQGVKNDAQVMALIMAESPEDVRKEDNIYKEMKATRDDAQLLSECVDELADDDDYMNIEDQSGKTVELPSAERRSLLVGLTLHERGRAALRKRDYPLALVLLLEADRQLSECRSSILQTTDNYAVLQLDVSWCYLWLQSLQSARDAAERLQRAEKALKDTYNAQRPQAQGLVNERVLMMRLYLLQGIVAFHQNKRTEAKQLLEKAEAEMNFLRVDETSVSALAELGWSRGQARTGLRAAAGDLDRAHLLLADKRAGRETQRDQHRHNRMERLLGTCMDGSPVNQQLVEGLMSMGYERRRAAAALQHSNNNVADAVRIIQETPELLDEDDPSSDDTGSPSSDDTVVEPDEKIVGELVAMGYGHEAARAALRLSRNHPSGAVDLLVAGGGQVAAAPGDESANPSTSAGAVPRKKQKKRKRDKERQQREAALQRLSSAIKTDEDEYLDTALQDEEHFLAQYKSLLQ